MEIDFTDERFSRRRIPWSSLSEDGIEPRAVMLAAQKAGEYRIARSARERWRRDQGGSDA
jgi:hypothetical protein